MAANPNRSPPKAIDLMDPELTLTRLEELQQELQEKQIEAEEERVARDFAAKYYAMLVGTLYEGELTARSCILMYRVDHFLKQLKEWAEGKRKQLPK